MPDVSASNISFKKIVNTDLAPVAVVAQCLDNQWVPRDLLTLMLHHGWSFDQPEVARRRLADSRHEYLRSILNAQQVIVNRAFFINNNVVYRDFTKKGPARDAFKDLLSKSAIIPYLVNDKSPVETQQFTVDSKGWGAWLKVAQEAESTCLRLSWDDKQNEEFTRAYLSKIFRRFLLGLPILEEDGLERDFGLDNEQSRQFKRRLREVSWWAGESDQVTREAFYRQFVVVDGSDPAHGRYDRTKPFSGELKQLADLRYNTVLADAMDRYALTPADSLHRAAMQEEHQVAKAKGVDKEVLLRTLQRRRTFDLAQGALDIGLTGLELQHVWQARRTDEWARYIESLRALLDAPEEFDVIGQQVYFRYVDLARQLAAIVGRRHNGATDRWEPIIRLTIEILGSVISIFFGAEPRMEVVGKVATDIAATAANAIVRFAVVGHDQHRASTQLGTSIDIMKIKFKRAGEEWEYLIAELKKAGFRMDDRTTREPEVDSNLDVPEEVTADE